MPPDVETLGEDRAGIPDAAGLAQAHAGHSRSEGSARRRARLSEFHLRPAGGGNWNDLDRTRARRYNRSARNEARILALAGHAFLRSGARKSDRGCRRARAVRLGTEISRDLRAIPRRRSAAFSPRTSSPTAITRRLTARFAMDSLRAPPIWLQPGAKLRLVGESRAGVAFDGARWRRRMRADPDRRAGAARRQCSGDAGVRAIDGEFVVFEQPARAGQHFVLAGAEARVGEVMVAARHAARLRGTRGGGGGGARCASPSVAVRGSRFFRPATNCVES